MEVDCACEIGGLAHSFRAMTSRLLARPTAATQLADLQGPDLPARATPAEGARGAATR